MEYAKRDTFLMNEHPHDLLPAFALGALDVDEASQVMQHVAACAPCRAAVESWGAVVGLLPYTVAPQAPPVAVKHRLFAMIDISSEVRPGAPSAAQSRWVVAGRWMSVAAACSLTLALVLGLLFVAERGRTETLMAQLGEREQALQNLSHQSEQERQQLTGQLNQRAQTLQQMNSQLGARALEVQRLAAQLDRERQETIFISNAVGQPLKSAQVGPWGKMFMKPGSTHAVLVVYGLKPPAAGKVYQFWLATAGKQAPLGTLTVGPDGIAKLAIEAPAPIDSYARVMVTVEQAPGSQSPSNEVILEATL
jgi:anti-sigma-K factor RskA